MAPSQLAILGSAALLCSATADAETPVEKVIGLLESLKEEVEKEGKNEAASYDKFACFCKEKTESKSESVKEQQDTMDTATATIDEKSAEQEEKATSLMERKAKHEELARELDEEKTRCKKLETEYLINAADLSKALSSLEKAQAALENSKSLLQVGNSVEECLQLADALGLIPEPKHTKISAFMQHKASVDPDDPEYAYHSDEILKLLGELHVDFTDQKDKLEKGWKEEQTACDEKKAALNKEIDSNNDAMETLEGEIASLKEEVSSAQDALDEAKDTFKDDSAYLSDLVHRCQDAAKSWDQRSSLRFEEVQAIEKAMEVIQDKVKDADESANERALFVAKRKPAADATSSSAAVVLKAASKAHATVAKHVPEVVKPETVAMTHATAEAAAVSKMASATKATILHAPTELRNISGAFVSPKDTHQLKNATPRSKALKFLESAAHANAAEATPRKKAVQSLAAEGKRLKSAALSTLAQKVKDDPFAKVKQLIQNLIERLLQEAKEEATQKGFCDTELGKSRHERDERHQQIFKQLAQIGTNKAQITFLEDEIEELGEAVKKLTADLDTATKLRAEEKEENAATVTTAKGGFEAVSEALVILKDFYKKAAKAKLFLQASPVDEDTDGPGFSGPNKGNQARSGGVIGMLEVIQSDFDRTIRMTQQAEREAVAEFVEFERTSKADIKGKETKVKLDEQELTATQTAQVRAKEDLKTETGLLDDCLRSIEELKPVCIDTGMSYAERVQKREAEIEALKSALCMIDPEKKEAECQ